jgi:hypothetical protein
VLGRHTHAVDCIIRCCLMLLSATTSFRQLSVESRNANVQLAVLARKSGEA